LTSPLDKISSSVGSKYYTVDQIALAFNTLNNAKSRAKYDAELKLQSRSINGDTNVESGFRTGVEVVDLDDLVYQEEEVNGGGMWYRSCRCGQERGFEVREEDLEEASRGGEGEVSVGCKGCSLWLRVLFGVLEEEEEGTGHKG